MGMSSAATPVPASVPLLQAVGLSKRFGGVVALDGVDLELWSGETLGVIGPNGAGKSTLIGLLSGALRPSSGEVLLDGRRVTGLAPHKRARLGIGRTYQIPQPFQRMTVLENVMLARLYGAEERGRAAKADCLRILERTGLAPLTQVPAGDLALLSLKRLELARALALKPRVLLLDEIGAGLVESELAELIDLIKSLRADVEAILVVEHVIDVIRECSDRVVVLDWGKKIAEGAPEDVLGDEHVAAVYLGTGTATAVRRGPARAPAGVEPLVSARNLAAGYGSFRALHDVSFEIYPGEIVTLLGANGAGKTTTARVLSGMLPAASGQVHFKGLRIDGKPAHEIVRLGIAHCMEGRRIFTDLTVEENLLLGGRTAPTAAERRRRLRRVYDLFPMLEEKRDDSGGSLSGGQQQMLAIGRALMADPEFIIFDELSLGLAPVAVDAIYEKIAELHSQGVTMLLIEQNVERGLALADRAYVLEKGVVALSGHPEEIRNDGRLLALYVGEAKGGA
jgi:branched-chain amino acid transport system ATP-binding protein